MLYPVGTSSITINPDPSLLSVALAGYGAPGAGRFSITWTHYCNFPAGTAVAVSGNHVYCASGTKELFMGTVAGDEIRWRQLSQDKHIVALAGDEESLYGLDDLGNLYSADPRSEAFSWNFLASGLRCEVLFTHHKSLYVCSNDAHIYQINIDASVVSRKLIGKRNGMISVTSNGVGIYGLDSSGKLWRAQANDGFQWVQIGRPNGYTYTIQPTQLYYLNERFYAIAGQHGYQATHKLSGNLMVTATAIGSGADTVVIIGIDVTGFDHTFTSEVKQVLWKRFKLAESAVMINASHTHFAPVTQDWTAWQEFYHHADPAYLNVIKDKIVEVVAAALTSQIPLRLSLGRGKTNIGFNRREHVHPDAAYDDTLDVIRGTDEQGQLRLCLFAASCHPVFNDESPDSPFTLSANFPGVTRKMLAEETGAQVIFIQGFAGDINPRQASYRDTGTSLFNDVSSVMKLQGKSIEGSISHSLHEISVPLETWDRERVNTFRQETMGIIADLPEENEDASACQFVLTPALERKKDLRWASIMADRYRQGHIPDQFNIYLQVITIGSWKLVGLSREVVADYARPIRALWPEHDVTLAAYCNDVGSYLPVDWHLKAKTYEGYDSFFWYAQPGIPKASVQDVVIDQIKSIQTITNQS